MHVGIQKYKTHTDTHVAEAPPKVTPVRILDIIKELMIIEGVGALQWELGSGGPSQPQRSQGAAQ